MNINDHKLAWQKYSKRRSIKNRNAIIDLNQGLIYTIFNKEFSGYQSIEEDLVQEAQIGLLKSVEGFDPKYNIQFSTYAGMAIRRAMDNFIKRKVKAVCRSRIGQTYTPVAIMCSIDPLAIDFDGCSKLRDITLNPTLPIDPVGPIARLTNILSDQEKEIVFSYIFDEESNQIIGNRLNFSREKTRQIKDRALLKLKQEIEKDAA